MLVGVLVNVTFTRDPCVVVASVDLAGLATTAPPRVPDPSQHIDGERVRMVTQTHWTHRVVMSCDTSAHTRKDTCT